MKLLSICLPLLAAALLLGACASIRSDPVHSSGTPSCNNANPGAADLPSAPLTGAQPRQD